MTFFCKITYFLALRQIGFIRKQILQLRANKDVLEKTEYLQFHIRLFFLNNLTLIFVCVTAMKINTIIPLKVEILVLCINIAKLSIDVM